jgi:hypothetical protein
VADRPPPARRVSPGDPIDLSADALNRLAEWLERQAATGAAPPLQLGGGGRGGRVLSDPTPRPWIGLLSGSSSPSSAVEQVYINGGWEEGAKSTDRAFEVNAKTGLGGKRVRLYQCGASDYCFQYVGIGSAPCTGTITGTIFGCGGTLDPRSGVLLTLKQGTTTLATTTTDGSGHYSLPITAAGTYTVTPSRARYASSPITVVAGCSANSRNIFLRADAGYVCCSAFCDPLPTTLTLTDANQTIILNPVYTISGPTGRTVYGWWGCYLLTRTGTVKDAYGNCVAATVTGAVAYCLYCPTAHRFCPFGSTAPPYCNYVLEQQWVRCVPPGATVVNEAALFAASDCGTIPSANAYDKSQNVPLSFLTYSDGFLTTRFVGSADRCPALPFAQSFYMPSDALIPGDVTVSE